MTPAQRVGFYVQGHSTTTFLHLTVARCQGHRIPGVLPFVNTMHTCSARLEGEPDADSQIFQVWEILE